MSKESNSKKVVIGFAQDSVPLSKIVVEPKKTECSIIKGQAKTIKIKKDIKNEN